MNKPSASAPLVSGTDRPLASARAHWTIYLPTLVVGAVWLAIYAWAELHEPPLAGLGALALAVEALGVPLLFFAAALRARLLTVDVWPRGREGTEGAAARELVLRDGFARPRSLRVGATEIATLRVRRSLPQRLFGGGALDLVMLSGERVFIADLDRPDEVAHALKVAPPHAHAAPGAPERLL